MKIVGFVAAGLVCLVAVVVGFVVFRNHQLLDAKFAIAVKAPPVAEGDEAVTRGEHIVHAVLACGECHGEDLGGKVMIKADELGSITAPNVTGLRYSDEDWARIVRHGVKPDGSPALIMPSQNYTGITDDDLADAIAYLREVPKVERVLEPTRLEPLARFLIAIGELHVTAHHIDHEGVEKARRVKDGAYLAAVSGCTDCHVDDAKGRQVTPDVHAPSRLADTMRRYDRAGFAEAVRHGKRPDGSTLNPLMPYGSFSRLTDAELDDLYAWLKG